ncbi:MAG: TolC family protein [Bacteriovoracaceae bacterium]
MLRFMLILSALVGVSLSHAEELDLNTALREVNIDSPDIASAKSRAEAARWGKLEAFGAGFLPRLKANANYLTDKKYQFINLNLNGAPVVFPSIFPNSQANIMAELPLFDGFASTNHYQAASSRSDAAQEDLNWDKFRTEMEVTLNYYRALAASQLRIVATQNLKVLQQHEKDAHLFRKSGLSTNFDVLRVQVQVSKANTDLEDAEDAIILTRQRLAQSLGHEKEDREIVGELPVPRPEVLQRARGESDRSDLRSLQLQSIALENERAAANRYWVPQFSFFANYNFYNNLSQGLNDWSSYRNSRQVGFLMTWNIFDGLVSHSQAKQAIERKLQSESSLRKGRIGAVRDVETWSRRFKTLCHVYQARLQDIKSSEESVRLAREGKRVGARTDNELLDAELDLSRSRADAVRAQLGAIEALIELQLAEGRRYL